MAIRKFKKNSPSVLSAYFKSTEFDCEGTGCCTETLIDDTLITILTKVRQRFGPVIITSGYRCQTHNREVGGASSSKHTKGMAVDFKVKDASGKYVDPVRVAAFIDSLYTHQYGIEVGSFDSSTGGYVHLDTRSGKWRAYRAYNTTQKYDSYQTLTPTLKLGSTGSAVTVLQRKLKGFGFYKKGIDKTFGPDLQAAVINFQRAYHLTADGIAGPKTWAKIIEKL